MKTALFAIGLTVLLVQPALADLTIKQTAGGKGLGLSGETTGTTYFKGLRMRSEVVLEGRTQTAIFDLDAQKMISFDSKKKEADVWDMAAVAAEVSKSVRIDDMKVSLEPNGETKTIAGLKAAGYALEISMPAMLTGNADMTMLVTLSGPVWIVKDAPGTADYLAFYKAAAEKGWVLSDPRAAKASPGPARAMTEMYRRLAEAGGIAYESDIQITMKTVDASNPLSGLLGKMGNVQMVSTVTDVNTASLSDDLFTPPAGYKLKPKK
jgi:hypothetical protein